MRVKLGQASEGGGASPLPFTTFTINSKVAVYAPAEWADTVTLFHLYQYMYSVVQTHQHLGPQSTYRGRVEMGRGVYSICPLSWSIQHNFVYMMVDIVKGGGRAPHPPHQVGLIFPS
jgi:hypothetical protein